MIFTSFVFVVFALVFFPLYYATRGRVRLSVCLAASYIFYGWWDWRFLSLILISTLVDYAVGRRMSLTEDERARRSLLLLSVCVNLGLLGFFKYFNFFAESFVDMANVFGFQVDYVTLNIILPVGISFYTFQTMSYTIDLYRRRLEVEKNFLNFATYVAFFPQLVAGPIVRAASLLPQLREDKRFDLVHVVPGVEVVLFGKGAR